MLECHFKIGGLAFKVSGNDLREVIEQSALLGEVAEKAAGRPNLVLFHRAPKGFNYYGLRDLDSGEELVFGQKKETLDLFLRREQGFTQAFQPGDQDRSADDPGTPQDQPPAPARPPQGSPPPPRQQQAAPRPAAPQQQASRPPAASPPRGAPPTQRRW